MRDGHDVVGLIESLFKYRGTNYSRVAETLGMSRQALFRMIKGNTLKMSMFLKIMDVLGLDWKMFDGDEAISLKPVRAPRVRKKIKGVQYDTDKMFSLCEELDYDGGVRELCYDPASKRKLIVTYRDGEKPKVELVAEQDFSDNFSDN